MNCNERNPVIVSEGDLLLLKELMTFREDKDDEMSFSHELARAIVMKDDSFPAHAIKLNSKVIILDIESQELREFIIVLPQEANLEQNKISVLSPIGTALIGFRKKEQVYWKSLGELKLIEIIDVIND